MRRCLGWLMVPFLCRGTPLDSLPRPQLPSILMASHSQLPLRSSLLPPHTTSSSQCFSLFLAAHHMHFTGGSQRLTAPRLPAHCFQVAVLAVLLTLSAWGPTAGKGVVVSVQCTSSHSHPYATVSAGTSSHSHPYPRYCSHLTPSPRTPHHSRLGLIEPSQPLPLAGSAEAVETAEGEAATGMAAAAEAVTPSPLAQPAGSGLSAGIQSPGIEQPVGIHPSVLCDKTMAPIVGYRYTDGKGYDLCQVSETCT